MELFIFARFHAQAGNEAAVAEALLVSIVSILRMAWLRRGRVRPVRVERPPATSSESADQAYGGAP